MRPYDFTPLYRSFVGFDRMANLIDSAAHQASTGNSYPPYNVIQLTENAYKIELAIAGFIQEDLELIIHENVLTITGQRASHADNDEAEYLHRGIAERGFKQRFQLADHVQIESADLKHGLLVISLKRELPEALKPKVIVINDPNLINSKPSRKAKAA